MFYFVFMFISLFCCFCVFLSVFVQKYYMILISDNPNDPGGRLGDSLWKLPNRRFHPDYYLTVTKPISMAQIRNKIKKSEYASINQLAKDLNLMLDNAKKAFSSTHKMHRDALKMQKLLTQKLADVESDDEETDDDDDDDEESTTNSSNQSIGKKKLKQKGASPGGSLNVSSSSPIINTGNSPKCKFPNNPMLKKKLLNLQKFLSEYTVSAE